MAKQSGTGLQLLILLLKCNLPNSLRYRTDTHTDCVPRRHCKKVCHTQAKTALGQCSIDLGQDMFVFFPFCLHSADVSHRRVRCDVSAGRRDPREDKLTAAAAHSTPRRRARGPLIGLHAALLNKYNLSPFSLLCCNCHRFLIGTAQVSE